MSSLPAEDAIRLFGVSGLMLQDELPKIETELGVKIRVGHVEPEQRDTEYYPQFDQQVRSEATAMARYYEVLYCLERSIRKLVGIRMRESKGLGWWDTDVPQAVRDEVKRNQQRELEAGVTIRSDDPLDYTTFGQLGDIISQNWENVFSDTFNNDRGLRRVMAQINTLRGPIAHCCPLSEDEILRLKLSVRDWYRLME